MFPWGSTKHVVWPCRVSVPHRAPPRTLAGKVNSFPLVLYTGYFQQLCTFVFFQKNVSEIVPSVYIGTFFFLPSAYNGQQIGHFGDVSCAGCPAEPTFLRALTPQRHFPPIRNDGSSDRPKCGRGSVRDTVTPPHPPIEHFFFPGLSKGLLRAQAQQPSSMRPVRGDHCAVCCGEEALLLLQPHLSCQVPADPAARAPPPATPRDSGGEGLASDPLLPLLRGN